MQQRPAPRYRPHRLDLHSIPDARLRTLRLLAESPDGQTLDRLLPERTGGAGGGTETALKRRSAWTSTFVASLAQEQGFTPIRVQKGAGAAAPAEQSTHQM
jgi:hypothetical protein